MFKIPLLSTGEKKTSPDYDKALHGSDSLPLKLSVKAFFKIALPFWKSKDSKVAWFLLFMIVALTASAVYLATAINSWYKSFWDTIQNYDVPGFKHYLLVFAFLATIHVVVSVYNSYLRSCLAIRWRRWLTDKVMHEWMSDDVYYRMQLADRNTENPDQRISEDLNAFVTYSISLLLGTASDLAMLGSFGVVLWDLSHAVTITLWNDDTLTLPDGYLLYLALVYAVMGTLLTFYFGKPLVKLNFRQQRYEADFRFSLIRVRENGESVSLYHGEQEEERILGSRFKNVVLNYIKLIGCEKRLGFFTLSYAQLAVIFPILVAAPMYFAKVITVGSIMQISSAFGRVQDSLSTIINNFSAWAAFKADIDRLALYFDSMDHASNVKCLKPVQEGESFKVSNIRVYTPQGSELCRDLSFELKRGDALLIRGRSGCGKSTLMKTVAGIWPYSEGEVIYPENSKVLFLSQRPYLPLGTLREAAAYPNSPERSGLTERFLKELGLEKLIPYLDTEDNWSQSLSLGEQQRIAVVRALLMKPDLLFLDEASSAMDGKSEQKAYGLIKELLASSVLVSVGHRSSLIGYHNITLECEDGSAWRVVKN